MRPPPILTSEPGSFARRTFEERIPHIVEQIIDANDFPADIQADMQALRTEILRGTIQPLREAAPDRAFWDEHSNAYVGRTWLDVPWYWAETFFYRRVLEATRYFQPGLWHERDPYANQKYGELTPDAGPHSLQMMLRALPDAGAARFNALLHASVWGNRADLSYNVAQDDPGSLAVDQEHANLVIDDTARVWEHLAARPGARVDVICDNAGTELLFDLALVDYLLAEGLAGTVKLHVKPHPFFVSDTMVKDVQAALLALSNAAPPELQQLARRLRQEQHVGHFVFDEHPFWVTCLFLFEMPPELEQDLARSNLVISKGDVNYRRLLGDAHWLPTTPFDAAVAYFPAPLVALRTLKAELIVGLPVGRAEELKAQDRDWMIDGKRGLVQFKSMP